MIKASLAVICDDVRREINNKCSLIGIFTAFNITDFTKPVPRFHLFARLEFEKLGKSVVSVELKSAEGKQLLGLQANVEIQATGKEPLNRAPNPLTSDLDLVLENLKLPGPGEFEVVWKDGTNILTILTFRAEYIKQLLQ